jgi:hypothetical protein
MYDANMESSGSYVATDSSDTDNYDLFDSDNSFSDPELYTGALPYRFEPPARPQTAEEAQAVDPVSDQRRVGNIDWWALRPVRGRVLNPPSKTCVFQ